MTRRIIIAAALAMSFSQGGGLIAEERKSACRLVPLRTGVCRLGKDHVLGQGYSADERMTFAIYSFLVEGPGGEKALVDLGPETLGYVNEMFRRYGFFRDLEETTDPGKRWPDDIVQPEGNVFAQLEKRGVPPAGIRHIVFTHLHADHHGIDDARNGGAGEKFGRALLHVSKIGWDDNMAKRKGGKWGSYVDYAFGDFLLRREKEGKVRFHDNAEIFEGLETVYLGGHSVCSQAVVVETATETAVIASDEVYQYGLLEKGILPRVRTSESKYREALDRLVRLAVERRAVILPVHDPLVGKAYREAGEGWLRALRPISNRAVRGYLKAREERKAP